MSLPQIDAVLAACGRRDASDALTMLRTVNTAAIPLVAGSDGWNAYKEFQRELLKARDGDQPTETQETDAFAKMMAEAKANARAGLT